MIDSKMIVEYAPPSAELNKNAREDLIYDYLLTKISSLRRQIEVSSPEFWKSKESEFKEEETKTRKISNNSIDKFLKSVIR